MAVANYNGRKTSLVYLERDGKYLILHRTKKEHDENGDKWIGVGGKFEPGETPDQCALREVKEETGLTMSDFRLRGLIIFVSDVWGLEYMYLYTATKWRGKLIDCDEGELVWLDKRELLKKNLWEGDKLFLKALDERAEFFMMKFRYEGERLVEVVDSRGLVPISPARLSGASQRAARREDYLRRTCAANRLWFGAGGRTGAAPQPIRAGGTLSSRHRRRRFALRLWRESRGEGARPQA